MTTAGKASVEVTGGEGYRIIDMMGNESPLPASGKLTVTAVPVYITSSGETKISTL